MIDIGTKTKNTEPSKQEVKEMKKVWILEKFVSVEEMNESLKGLKELQPTNENEREALKEAIAAYEKRIQESPKGYWCGYAGRTNYNDFCREARRTMNNLKGSKFRVVKAEIGDVAHQWLGYVNPVENEGVLRYLYATL